MLGMLYVAQAAWAAFYLIATVAAAILGINFVHRFPLVATLVIVVYVASIIHAYRLASAYSVGKQRPHYSRWYGLLGIYLGMGLVIFGFRAFLFEPFRHPSGSMLPTIETGSIFVVQKWGYGHYGTWGIPVFQRPISSELRRGDIIVFDHQTDADTTVQFVKRLIGLPGDTITYRDKKLIINGIEIPHIKEGDYTAARDAKDVQSLIRYTESLDGMDYSVIINENVNWIITQAPTFFRQEGCVYDNHGETCKIPAGYYFVMGDNRDNSNDSRYWGFVPAMNIVGKMFYMFR